MGFEIHKQQFDTKIAQVTLGATEENGGTRKKAITLGGSNSMPFDQVSQGPFFAMEVFDYVPEKYPKELQTLYKDCLDNPASMAQKCVEFGADCISVRLYGTHPDVKNFSEQKAVETVGSVLEAVEVPIIVTGINHFEKNNLTLKKVAEVFQGENLLLNWVETDNYKTISAAALAYNHSVVAQSPIDVNMAKQLNILVGNVGMKKNNIVIDPMTSPLGYGLEYSYTMTERIRLAAFYNDEVLASPMLCNVGFECMKIKEVNLPNGIEESWGEISDRILLWELLTSYSLMLAGGDLFIVYHPEAIGYLKKAVNELKG